jgi:hypothetical protein
MGLKVDLKRKLCLLDKQVDVAWVKSLFPDPKNLPDSCPAVIDYLKD